MAKSEKIPLRAMRTPTGKEPRLVRPCGASIKQGYDGKRMGVGCSGGILLVFEKIGGYHAGCQIRSHEWL